MQSNPGDADARDALRQLYGTESLHFMPLGEASKAARLHALWLIEHQPRSHERIYSISQELVGRWNFEILTATKSPTVKPL